MTDSYIGIFNKIYYADRFLPPCLFGFGGESVIVQRDELYRAALFIGVWSKAFD